MLLETIPTAQRPVKAWVPPAEALPSTLGHIQSKEAHRLFLSCFGHLFGTESLRRFLADAGFLDLLLLVDEA